MPCSFLLNLDKRKKWWQLAWQGVQHANVANLLLTWYYKHQDINTTEYTGPYDRS